MKRRKNWNFCITQEDTTKQDVTDQKKFFQFHGESYHSFLECCKLHGVSYDAVRNYQKYHEITKEEALEHYISMDKAFLFRNVIYDDFFFLLQSIRYFTKYCDLS